MVGSKKSAKQSDARASERASAHAIVKDSARHVVNGRLVSRTIADSNMQAAVKRAEKQMFPNREAALEHFRKKGVLTPTGKLTKAYGG